LNILVINAGSVTIKYKLFNESEDLLLSGKLDNKNGRFVSELIKEGTSYNWELTSLEFAQSAKLIANEVKDYKIDKIAFRIVHGGEEFIKPTLLDDQNLEKLQKISGLAPLHNPAVIKQILAFKELFPTTPIYGVFDTAYYAKFAAKAYMYGLPYEYYTHYQVRRYGFHGLAHQYLANEMARLEPACKKVITCHLGGGASISAIDNVQSIDTSMGFTPLEGLIMATRAGDVDDGAIKYIQDKTHFSDEEMDKIENFQSGLLGISGYTADMRTLLIDSAKGNSRAKLAIDMYIYRIQKYIGSFAAVLNGVEAIAISGGVGAGSDQIRAMIFTNLAYLGFEIDTGINNGKIDVTNNLKISSNNSKPIWIIPSNEELQILRDINSNND
jgi:acetate kinase